MVKNKNSHFNSAPRITGKNQRKPVFSKLEVDYCLKKILKADSLVKGQKIHQIQFESELANSPERRIDG